MVVATSKTFLFSYKKKSETYEKVGWSVGILMKRFMMVPSNEDERRRVV